MRGLARQTLATRGGPVPGLGLQARRGAHDEHDAPGRGGNGHGLRQQLRGGLARCRVVRRGVGQLDAQGIAQRVQPRGVHPRRAGALVSGLDGECPDQRDACGVAQWQEPVVAEQHGSGDSGAARQGVMGVEIHRLHRALAQGICAQRQRDHPGGRGAQVRLGESPRFERRDDFRGECTAVARHLQVHPGPQPGHDDDDHAENPAAHPRHGGAGDRRGAAGPQRGDAVIGASPVGDDQAVEPPFTAQHVAQQPRVVAAPGPVDAVVRGHHGRRPAAFDHDLEAAQVVLAQRALVDQRIDDHARALLVVGREVLRAGPDPLALDAIDDGGSEVSRQHWILREVLEVAPAARVALHVQPRAQQHRHVLGTTFAP